MKDGLQEEWELERHMFSDFIRKVKDRAKSIKVDSFKRTYIVLLMCILKYQGRP